jgi:hypothetical protein
MTTTTRTKTKRRLTALFAVLAAFFAVALAAPGAASASTATQTVTQAALAATEYRVPASNSIDLTPLHEATAVYVDAQVINGSTQHSMHSAYIGDLVTTNTGTQYYLQGGVVRIQYWDGSKFVSFGGWDFGDCGYRCYGWKTPTGSASTAFRPGAVYAAFDLTLGSGLGHTTGRYKL